MINSGVPRLNPVLHPQVIIRDEFSSVRNNFVNDSGWVHDLIKGAIEEGKFILAGSLFKKEFISGGQLSEKRQEALEFFAHLTLEEASVLCFYQDFKDPRNFFEEVSYLLRKYSRSQDLQKFLDGFDESADKYVWEWIKYNYTQKNLEDDFLQDLRCLTFVKFLQNRGDLDKNHETDPSLCKEILDKKFS